ncbi:MAG: hypothetical protein K2L08_01145, partial [Erysipelotrichaceae bacterium]|nr:hypothetical protein [Erysipelotrichaceae bacterium]
YHSIIKTVLISPRATDLHSLFYTLEVEQSSAQGNGSLNYNGGYVSRPSTPSYSGGTSNNNSTNSLGYYPSLIGNSGKVFTSKEEASAWASAELDRYLLEGKYYGYDLMPIGVEGRDFDFWTVYFY